MLGMVYPNHPAGGNFSGEFVRNDCARFFGQHFIPISRYAGLRL
jgi:hypothetical protein